MITQITPSPGRAPPPFSAIAAAAAMPPLSSPHGRARAASVFAIPSTPGAARMAPQLTSKTHAAGVGPSALGASLLPTSLASGGGGLVLRAPLLPSSAHGAIAGGMVIKEDAISWLLKKKFEAADKKVKKQEAELETEKKAKHKAERKLARFQLREKASCLQREC